MNKLKVLLVGCLLSAELLALGSVDISKISIGARPLGMGGSFVALADDPSAMFINPAGLGQLTDPYFNNTQTNLLGEVNYFIISGTFPFDSGVLATSFQQAAVEGIPLTSLDSNGHPFEYRDTAYKDCLFMLAYGMPIDHRLSNRDWYTGFTLKYFSKGVDDIALGRGFDFDLGFLYKNQADWQIGLAQKNLLTALFDQEMIIWTTGAKDKLDSYTKVGFLYRLQPDWHILIDYDFSIRRGKTLFHLGTEYAIKELLHLRFGWEQIDDCVQATNFNHFTIGFSFALGGVSFGYAYIPYYEMEKNAAHYISVQYQFRQDFTDQEDHFYAE